MKFLTFVSIFAIQQLAFTTQSQASDISHCFDTVRPYIYNITTSLGRDLRDDQSSQEGRERETSSSSTSGGFSYGAVSMNASDSDRIETMRSSSSSERNYSESDRTLINKVIGPNAQQMFRDCVDLAKNADIKLELKIEPTRQRSLVITLEPNSSDRNSFPSLYRISVAKEEEDDLKDCDGELADFLNSQQASPLELENPMSMSCIRDASDEEFNQDGRTYIARPVQISINHSNGADVINIPPIEKSERISDLRQLRSQLEQLRVRILETEEKLFQLAEGSISIGGAYDMLGNSCKTKNPLTNSCSCGSEFKALDLADAGMVICYRDND